MPNGHSTPERITALEVSLKDIREDLRQIKDNHLVHLETKIDNLENKVDLISIRMAYYAGGLAVLMLIAQSLAHYILK